jgi:hypothetical protein
VRFILKFSLYLRMKKKDLSIGRTPSSSQMEVLLEISLAS